MTWEIVTVLILIFIMSLGLFLEWARPEFIVFSALAVLILVGIVEPGDALKGFSNEGMLTIGLLFIVAGAVQQSGFLKSFVHILLGNRSDGKKALLRLIFPVAGFSAFLNNTPIVVMLAPLVRQWCKDHGIAPSKLLMPLSFATVIGGMITLIGTSTNLVVHGLMLESGLSGFTMFTLAIVGIPGAIVALLYLMTIGYRLLPNRKGIDETLYVDSRDYLVEMRVNAECPLIGRTIEQGNLRNLSGLYLFEIIRDDRKILPVTPSERIREGDRLIFTGMVSTIGDLQQIKGLSLETGTNIQLDELRNGDNQIIEVVVSHHSPLVNRTIKQSQFRNIYGAAVISVHRKQERIESKVGDIVIKPGDVLLLIASQDFVSKYGRSMEFYFINVPEQPHIFDHTKSIITMLTLILLVLLVAFNVISMFKSAILAVLILALTRCISVEDAKRSVHFDVLLLIASAFGIGVALDQTGAAQFLSNYMVEFGSFFGVVGVFAVLYLITNVATEFLSNGAVVALMFPIALRMSEQLGVDPISVMVVIAIAASAGFSTPIGYQTNLIVYGPGGYRFSDFVKVGLPLNLIYMVITVMIVSMVWL